MVTIRLLNGDSTIEIICNLEDLVWVALVIENSPTVTTFEVWRAGVGKLDQKQKGYVGFQKWK